MLIDLPPGTGDEPLSVLQLISDIDGVIIVTIPSEVSKDVVKKAITFARKMETPIIGIIENMSSLVRPQCGEKIEVFGKGGGEKMAVETGVPLLGSIPLDPRISIDSDSGVPYISEYRNSEAFKIFDSIVQKIEKFVEGK